MVFRILHIDTATVERKLQNQEYHIASSWRSLWFQSFGLCKVPRQTIKFKQIVGMKRRWGPAVKVTIWDEDAETKEIKEMEGKGVLTQSGKWCVLFGENPFHLFQLTALSACWKLDREKI